MLIAGNSIAGGIEKRGARKKMEKLSEELFPDKEVPEVFSDNQAALAKTIGSMGPPGMGAMQGVQMPAMQGAQRAAAGQAEGQNAQMAKLRALMTSGNPMAQKGAMSVGMSGMMPKKPLVLGGGVYRDEQGNIHHEAAEKPLEFKPGHTYELEMPDGTKKNWTAPKSETGGTWGMTPVATDQKDARGNVLYQDYLRNNKSGTLGEPQGALHPKGQGVTINTGDQGRKLTKTSLSKVQAEIIDLSKSRERVSAAWDNYDAKFLTFPDKGWRGFQSLVDKSGYEVFTGNKAFSDESWGEYEKSKMFMQDVWSAVNAHIKHITGAQMSEREVPRILKSIAHTSDSPHAFEAKMRRFDELADRTHERMIGYLNAGELPDGYHTIAAEEYGKLTKEGAYTDDDARTLARRKAAQQWAADEIKTGGYAIAGIVEDEFTDDPFGEPEPTDG
jgi:hypothetical protein